MWWKHSHRASSLFFTCSLNHFCAKISHYNTKNKKNAHSITPCAHLFPWSVPCFNVFIAFIWAIVLGRRGVPGHSSYSCWLVGGQVQTRPQGKRKWGVGLNILTYLLTHPWNHLIVLISSVNVLPKALRSNFISLTNISASCTDVFISLH